MKPFVRLIEKNLYEKLLLDLKEEGFSFHKKEHTLFDAKKEGLTVTLYKSFKLVVQGKNSAEFIEFYLEPVIFGQLTTYIPHIGVDESGKGDFFGPLCVAAVYADASHVELLHKRGIGESKNTADKKAHEDALFIAKHIPFQLLRISPKKYNELYGKFKNLNSLLGWGHASVIAELNAKTGCNQVIIDQFAKEHVVLNALKHKNLSIDLTQRHKGEEDIVVAAASLIARASFLKGLTILQDHYKMAFPKGASKNVVSAAREFVKIHGKDALHLVAKVHFKTTNEVL